MTLLDALQEIARAPGQCFMRPLFKATEGESINRWRGTGYYFGPGRVGDVLWVRKPQGAEDEAAILTKALLLNKKWETVTLTTISNEDRQR